MYDDDCDDDDDDDYCYFDHGYDSYDSYDDDDDDDDNDDEVFDFTCISRLNKKVNTTCVRDHVNYKHVSVEQITQNIEIYVEDLYKNFTSLSCDYTIFICFIHTISANSMP